MFEKNNEVSRDRCLNTGWLSGTNANLRSSLPMTQSFAGLEQGS